MRNDKNEIGVIDGEYTLTRWLELYNAGVFDVTGNSYRDMQNAIDAGAYDWWNDASARTWVKRLGNKAAQLCKSTKIDTDNMYVFYKQICPCSGPLYDSFRICDIHSGEVVYCINNIKSGCYGETFSGWELYQFDNRNEVAHERGDWKTIKSFFGI